MGFKLSAPSKTFILGEYLALLGGPALVAATGQRFELVVNLQGHPGLEGIHPESPAGRVYVDNPSCFEGVHVEFVDPYLGAGGLGASSAQFVLMLFLKSLLTKDLKSVNESLSAHQVWLDYRQMFSTTDTWLPSGADVVAQLIGGISWFQWKPFKIEKLTWSFEGLSFLVFKTPHKVSTHEHLSQLKELNPEKLQSIVLSTIEALKNEDSLKFIKGLRQFDVALREQNLICNETIELLNDFKMSESVLAAKGCGALGADTIFVVCENKDIEGLKSLAKVVGLTYVASNKNISPGIQMEYTYDFKKRLAFKSNEKPSSTEATL